LREVVKMARTKKVEKTQEELALDRLKSELNRIMEEFELIPEPNYKFNIGDRVTIGNLKDVTVEEVLQDGKIYKIDYTSIETNYGNPITKPNQKRYVVWHRIRRYNEEQEPSLIKNKDLQLYYSQRTVGDLLTKAYTFGVNFEPEYQREYVWELDDKVKLIDSIFNNVDIGKFLFIHKDFGDKYLYEILDGKQRMRAILDFYEDRFKYKGYYFSDLSVRDQDHLEDYTINIAEVKDISEEQILRYFLMVNTTGKTISEEHLDKIRKRLDEIQK
jgi:hypothetical protein